MLRYYSISAERNEKVYQLSVLWGLANHEECHSECNDVKCGAIEANALARQETVAIICYKITI